MAVMEQAVEDGSGQDLIAEDGAPLGDDLVGRDESAAAFVPPGDELEEQVSSALLER